MTDDRNPASQGRTDPCTLEAVLERWERDRGLTDGLPRALYVSTPITSGPRFLDWYRREGRKLKADPAAYWRGMRAEVILPNRQMAGNFIEALRWQIDSPIIDPSAFDMPDWEQQDYHQFWLKILEKHVRRVIFMTGWAYSTGCTLELEHALLLGLDCVDQDLKPLDIPRAVNILEQATIQAAEQEIPLQGPTAILERLHRRGAVATDVRLLYKDEVLDRLARTANVAQFVSFAPSTLEPRFSRIAGRPANTPFKTLRDAIETLLVCAPEGMLNIRSFDPARPEGNPFLRDLNRVDDIHAALVNLGKHNGLYTILNEKIDISDGGVSGVAYRGAIEFAPDATPRVVDDPEAGTAYLPFRQGMRMLEIVYGVRPALDGFEGARVEFSIHPRPRGWNRMQTVIWQTEQRPGKDLDARPVWPNRFSRLLGDKVYGLLLADLEGLLVPRTMVFTKRGLFPFSFGRSTGSGQQWTRTAPAVKVPGYYPSVRGWYDPYHMLTHWQEMTRGNPAEIQPEPLSSVLVQEGVEARFSGRILAVGEIESKWKVAGVSGTGEEFMLGDTPAEALPSEVQDAVRRTAQLTVSRLGPVSIEWAFDGVDVWILQVNSIAKKHSPLHSVDDVRWVSFAFRTGGIEEFRRAAAAAKASGKGIRILGNVSPLSHIGEIADVLGVPVEFVNH